MIIDFAELPAGTAFKRHPAEPNGPVYVKLVRLLVPAALEEGEKTARYNAVCFMGPEERKGRGIFVADYTPVVLIQGVVAWTRGDLWRDEVDYLGSGGHMESH